FLRERRPDILINREVSTEAYGVGVKDSKRRRTKKSHMQSTLVRMLGWWWADPIAALVMVPIIAKEGIEGIKLLTQEHGFLPHWREAEAGCRALSASQGAIQETRV